MKGNARKAEYRVFLLSLYIILPLLGWYFSGIVMAIFSLPVAYLADLLFPKWKHDLSWSDIELALKNIYVYGNIPCELTFIVDNRRIFVYRDEKEKLQKGSKASKRIRMAIRIPLADWSDILSENELNDLFNKYGGMAFISSIRGPESYNLFAKNGHEVESCKNVLETLFEKAVGGLKPEIFARSVVNSKKHIWIEHVDNENGETAAS